MEKRTSHYWGQSSIEGSRAKKRRKWKAKRGAEKLSYREATSETGSS